MDENETNVNLIAQVEKQPPQEIKKKNLKSTAAVLEPNAQEKYYKTDQKYTGCIIDKGEGIPEHPKEKLFKDAKALVGSKPTRRISNRNTMNLKKGFLKIPYLFAQVYYKYIVYIMMYLYINIT